MTPSPAVIPALVALLLAGVVWLAISAYHAQRASTPTLIRRHLNRPGHEADHLAHPVRDWERVNYHLALEWLRREAGTDMVGHAAQLWVSITELAQTHHPCRGVTVRRLPCGPDEMVEVPENVLYLLRVDGQPYCAILSARASPDPDMPAAAATSTLEILALSTAHARAAVDQVIAAARRCNVYRGKSIALVEAPNGGDYFKLEFQDVPAVRRDEIVLPEELMQALERNVLGFLTHAETLRKAGRSTRHGVLLHGPPGVGKTLVTRYLLAGCKGHTAILLTGRNLHFVRESMQMARLLAPSVVVFEDVDLIAEERTTNRFGGVLQELLEALDGLGRRTECIVLLTTNRPELLEPALAARPGRVDQAIQLGLPDADCRRQLLALYGRGLDLADVDLGPWVERTEGVSPAFLAEWLRKSALWAAQRGERDMPLRVTGDDLENAFRELVLFGGRVTQKILGFRAANAEPSVNHR